MSEDYEISDTDKIKIAKEFLRYAPPGEFSQVYKDVSIILDKDIANDEEIQACSLDYHEDQLTPVRTLQATGDNQQNLEHMTLISGISRLEGMRYYDSKNHLTFEFNPITGRVSDIQPASSNLRPIEQESLRKSLEQAIMKYTGQHYPAGVCTITTQIDEESTESNDFMIHIEDHEFQPHNRWNGKWRSEWQLSVHDEKIVLRGGTKVHVHYYEDSNVQLVTKRMFDELELEGLSKNSTNEEICESVVKSIKKSETRYQQALRDNYVTMNDTTFKTLRRALPINKQKFNWEAIAQFKIGKEIQGNNFSPKQDN